MDLNNLDEQPSQTLAWGGVKLQTKSKTPHQRKISDPIHGFMYFDNPIWKVVDTPVYQRLRNIKQLGAVYQVYQGANHTRFEHSLGVGYLGYQFIKQIFENQPELEEDTQERARKVKLVTIAGIVHDLGHGPFSHMFDNLLIPKLTNKYTERWTHEQGSQDLFEYLCQEYDTGLDKKEIQFINDLVHGKQENGWISEIVANYRNGLDVDKMDYLNRDSKQLGMAYEIRDFELLMKEARVIDNKICYPTKYADNLLRIYDTRHKLYRQVYLNRVVQAVELMIADIMIEVNSHFKFEEIIYNPLEYYKLNDSIIEQIDNTKKVEFNTAQSIIQRIKTRNLYKFVAECQIPFDKQDKIQWDSDIIQKNIHSFAENVKLTEIYIMIGSINYGTSNNNPLELITYYKKYATEKDYKIVEYNDSFSSYCRPKVFLEQYIRVFTSNPDAVKELQIAFNKFCHHHLGSKPSNDDYVNGTPKKKNKQD